MDEPFDFVVIGGGPAGEAAAYLARARDASVAVVDRELFGGSCPFWACMPSRHCVNRAVAEGQTPEEVFAMLVPVQSVLYARK